MVKLKKLIQSGNSVAVVLDKELLEAAGLEAGATVEIDVSDGIISIGKSRQKRAAKVDKLLTKLDGRYKAVFKKLAE
jgi:antitoxin component of MazEF toxin-antitoxin module